MKNSFSSQQISKNGNLDSNLLSGQYKLTLMAKFMQIKFENPRSKQSEIAEHLGYSSSTLQRYRNDIIMLSPYRIQPNITNKRTKKALNTNFDNNSHREKDLKRPQKTSNDFVKPDTKTKFNNRNKNTLKGGSMHENVEIIEECLDDFLLNKNF